MSLEPSRPLLSPLLRGLGATLLASPAAAAWLLSRDAKHRRAICAGAFVTSLLVVGLLLSSSLRWQLASGVWLSYCLAGGLAAILWLRPTTTVEKLPNAAGWERKTLVSALPLAWAAVSLLALARLTSWVLWQPFLLRWNPRLTDASEDMVLLLFDALWVAPAAVVFAAASFRRGRLQRASEVARAVLSWTLVLWAMEWILLGTFGALKAQTIGLTDLATDSDGQMMLLRFVMGIAVAPLAGFVAWGEGSMLRRLAALTVFLMAALLSLSITLGLTERFAFARGRALDRQGNFEGAVSWYGRSLVLHGKTEDERTAYLQHRIGLLQYQRGFEERALAAFRLSGNGVSDRQVQRDSQYFLERLASPGDGDRVVIDGIEVESDLRGAYCAPNTLALVYRHWDRLLSVRAIGEEVALIGSGTMTSDMVFLTESLDLDLYLHPFASLDGIRWLIDRQIPSLVFTPGHVQAIFGYDDRLGTLITYDTADWDIWVDQPIPDLLEKWGRRSFQLGVILPRGEAVPPEIVEARQRFGGSRSRANWFWTLYLEQEANTAEEVEYLRRALLEDPSFYLPLFQLAAELNGDQWRRWLEHHADEAAAAGEARQLMTRPYGPTNAIWGMLRWLQFQDRGYDELVDLAERLGERHLLDSTVAAWVTESAAAEGLWPDAALWANRILELDPAREEQRQAFNTLGVAYNDSEQETAALDAFAKAATVTSNGGIEWVIEQIELLTEEGDPARESPYIYYLNFHRDDVKRTLAFARLTFDLAQEQYDDDRRKRLRWARRAATYVRALAADQVIVNEASELLQAVEQATSEDPS